MNRRLADHGPREAYAAQITCICAAVGPQSRHRLSAPNGGSGPRSPRSAVTFCDMLTVTGQGEAHYGTEACHIHVGWILNSHSHLRDGYRHYCGPFLGFVPLGRKGCSPADRHMDLYGLATAIGAADWAHRTGIRAAGRNVRNTTITATPIMTITKISRPANHLGPPPITHGRPAQIKGVMRSRDRRESAPESRPYRRRCAHR
jgi:hypothetical protein